MIKTPKRPLEISCKAARCDPSVPAAERRHSFVSSPDALPGMTPSCRSCERTDLVDWERVQRRDPADLDAIVSELRKELIRDNYWAEPLPARIVRNAARRSREDLHASARRLLTSALTVAHPYAGRQTPFAYNPHATIVHCAQHATATCCRACLETWFAIPRAIPLGPDDFAFLCALADRYTVDRLARPDDVLPAEAA
ncbi:MAG: hypothetical protein JWL77_7132 [Chthonomonadaceae bacterium]|nr:hypothetical protein [Chthonomonadaceae bacterium]